MPKEFRQLNFDTYIAERQRDLAITAAGQAADDAWRNAALQAVHDVAQSLPEFTADEVFERLASLPVQTHEARAFGAVIRLAQRLEWCTATNRFVKSRRVSRHRAPIQVWVSRLYGRMES
jgi:hypothetical protein